MEKQNRKPKNILIIKWGALGDILAATPTIKKVKDTFPDAKITFLSTSLAKHIFKHSDIIDNILDRKNNVITNVSFIRKKKIDIVLNLQWGSEGADLYSLCSGAKIKIGGSSKRYLRHLYHFTPPFITTDYNQHEYLKNLDIFSSYTNVDRTNLEAFIPVHQSSTTSHFLKEKGDFIVISPAASTLKKAWRKERYVQLSKMIYAAYGYNIIVTYAPEDEAYAREISTQIGKGSFLSPLVSINEVAHIVQQSKLCICNNSGIMHIAFAVQTPVMCFNTSIGWHPYGKSDISIDRIPNDLKDNRALDNERVKALLDTITVDEAFSKFKTLQN